MKIAQGLLLRKQLEKKVAQLEPIKQMGEQGIFAPKITRVNIAEQIDEVSMQIPKITLEELTSEYDKYASALRKLDAALQRANWEYDLKDFVENDNPFEK